MSKSDNSLILPNDFKDYKVAALPIIANFCQQLGINRIVDKQIDSPENISSGQVVVGMVMDTLSGRSPLYKLHEYFDGQDTELLFGTELKPSDFNDNNVGKVLDNIHAYGASQLFSQITYSACQKYDLNMKYMHYDTTSVSVHGDYDGYERETAQRIAITHGHSKDLRPDMKQFMMDALCVEGAIPLLGATLSGNKADKKANNTELTRVASLMKKHKLDPKAYIYIADSALVSADNLEALKKQPFITRLPGNYKVENQLIDTAFEADDWTYVGALAEHVDPSKKRISARYKLYETQVEVYGTTYRALVVHSTSHDKRRLKKTALDFHQLQLSIEENPIYERGRPKQGQPRKIKQQRYQISAELLTLQQQVDKVKQRSGCFVLISNVTTEGEHAHDATEILTAYKQQYGIEMNFRFLKDPIMVNDTFLKKPERIEALGFILLLSLMVWNLIQHIIRKHIKEGNTTLLGWDNKQTHAPTTMMVLFYFQHISIFVWNQGRHRKLSTILKPHQKDYLCAMRLPESIFTTPVKTYRN